MEGTVALLVEFCRQLDAAERVPNAAPGDVVPVRDEPEGALCVDLKLTDTLARSLTAAIRAVVGAGE